MKKINQEEYEILKKLDDKWKWIARDELLDEIKIFNESPTRHHKMNYWTTVAYTHLQARLFGPNLFQFIQWEDSEPYNIVELIEEYESEETEVKNIEWLKRKIEEHIEPYEEEDYLSYSAGCTDVAEIILELIDQLDELEVEENCYTFDNSKKWLEDNGFVVFEKDKLDAEVQRMIDETYKTMNEKPVIPDYVAEWIDTNKEKYDLVQLFWEIGEGGLVNLDVDRWIEENPNTFARAWLDGYTVEEKKYYIKIGPTRYARKYLEDRIDNQLAMFEKDAGVFTEKEILKLENGDKLWAFAEEVTE